MNIKLKALSAVVALCFAGASMAAVTLNADGTGFVGKGDVQLAFGWNNHLLQANAAGVSFDVSFTESYTAVCTWTTGEGTRGERVHNVDHKKTSAIASGVAFEARQRNQITGFNLKGYTGFAEEGTVPVVGEPCPGNQGHGGVWTSVEQTGSSGGLFVNYGSLRVQLAY